MRGPDLSNLRETLSRINQIQTRFEEQAAFDASSIPFDALMRKALNESADNALCANQVLGNLAFINNLDYLNMRSAIDLSEPEKMINYSGYQMQAQAADRFQKLEYLISKEFPGRKITLTSSTDGTHSDPNHYAGKALDFVVDGLTKEESVRLEDICRQAGFKPYNEYLHSSYYKTGDHMHVDLID